MQLLSTESVVSGITYIYWAALYLHLFSAVAWLGGVLFLTGVTRPIFEYYKDTSFDIATRIKVRFMGFTWMLTWTTLITGAVILLWSTRFLFFDFSSLWSVLMHLKILFFVILFILNLGLRSSYRELATAREETIESEDISPRDVILWRVRMIEQIEVWCAIIILFIVSLAQIN
jgi:putative copper export protein